MGRAKEVLDKLEEASVSTSASSRRVGQAIDLARQAEVTHYQYKFVIKPLSKDSFKFMITGPSKDGASKILSDIMLDAGYKENEFKIS